MRTHPTVLICSIVMLPLLAACDSFTTRPLKLSPLPLDTGSLGLAPVAGFKAFTLLDDSVVHDSAAKQFLARRRAEPTTSTARVIRFADGIDSMLAIGNAIAFDVNPTRRLVYVIDQVSRLNTGYTTWSGKLQGGLSGGMTLGTNGAGIANGSAEVIGPSVFQYAISSLGNGLHVIVYVDYRRYLPD